MNTTFIMNSVVISAIFQMYAWKDKYTADSGSKTTLNLSVTMFTRTQWQRDRDPVITQMQFHDQPFWLFFPPHEVVAWAPTRKNMTNIGQTRTEADTRKHPYICENSLPEKRSRIPTIHSLHKTLNIKVLRE